MARPIYDSGRESPLNIAARRDLWLQKLHQMEDEGLSRELLVELTHGNRKKVETASTFW